ncbi:MAG: Zn-dependent exopeptidase M28, partial [Deltaproteobacteria bacterium]|nr:Zn-dependent exopeptidase M28 [Deltaproteobacteria bacterium]
PALPPAITYAATQTRDFERRYWATIAELATERWRSKNNADRVASAGARDLDDLADELARRHAAAIARHRVAGSAIGHHWFRWETDFHFPWSAGWAKNQVHGPRERNVICVIPGRNRREAVVLADHYDTAYMEDVYDGKLAGVAAHTRHAAPGADDNHSATAALLLAADVLLPLSRAGALERDVWLVHLTGEEFPGDSLGARQLVRRLVEGTLALADARDGRAIDLAGVEVTGAIVMDMIAHRGPRAGYRFQIAPGEGDRAMAVALAAHLATERWNASAARKNRGAARVHARPYRRRPTGTRVPAIAPHAHLVGEIRPHWHWSSTVFNTDAQCASDAGLPIALFMEHYDIDRRGYHDTLDTLANIDLDFGAAIAAVAIETAAALATAR